jgi:hypothetical protein
MKMAKTADPSKAQEHLRRVRQICSTLADTTEKVSHGEPTFFAGKKVYVMFASNHHNDGHIAIWVPAEPGEQEALIHADPKKYFRPPYVGVKGWLGVELEQIGDEELAIHILSAWRKIASKPGKRALSKHAY